MAITVSTHVLDVTRGTPAAGVPVAFERLAGTHYTRVSDAVTDADGRASLASQDARLVPARYRLTFDTAAYADGATWYPQVIVVVELAEGSGHTHIPLLLSPFGYTTYRGS